jgi:hypothetical protein
VRIAGIRVAAPYASLLADLVESAGFSDTALALRGAIGGQVTVEAPLTVADREAILAALGESCPPPLTRLRRALADERDWRIRHP